MREYEDVFDWEVRERKTLRSALEIAVVGLLIVLGMLYHKYS